MLLQVTSSQCTFAQYGTFYVTQTFSVTQKMPPFCVVLCLCRAAAVCDGLVVTKQFRSELQLRAPSSPDCLLYVCLLCLSTQQLVASACWEYIKQKINTFPRKNQNNPQSNLACRWLQLTPVSFISVTELLQGEDAGHHVSGLPGGQVVGFPGGVPAALAPHHPGLRRGGHGDEKHSAALSGLHRCDRYYCCRRSTSLHACFPSLVSSRWKTF